MEIRENYERIKKLKRFRLLTNCYSLDVVEKANRVWETDGAFLFSFNDHGVNRLVYYARDYRLLERLLSMVEGGKYYLEFMTRNPGEYIPTKLTLVTKMMRMVNVDCRSVLENSSVLQYKDDTVGEQAGLEDVREINQLLWSTFHTEVSHLLTDLELEDVIREGQVSIHRGDGIDAILQLKVMPKRLYINQVVNKTDRSVIHAMLLQRLSEYVRNGGRYMYAWVEDHNIASLKFHGKYGMVHDGMWDVIYCLER